MTDRLDAFLDGAVKAARTRAEAGVDDGAATRMRLRESLANGAGRTSRSGKKLVTIITAVIGSLFGSFAFAAYVTGWNPLSREPETPPAAAPVVAVEAPTPKSPRHAVPAPAMPEVAVPARVEPPVPPVVEPPVTADNLPPLPVAPGVAKTVAPARPKVRKPRAQPAPVVVAEVVDEPPPPPVTIAPAATTPAAPPAQPAPAAPAPTPPAPTPPKSDGLAAYRVAHEAHFRGDDAKAALAAWDAYLAKHPKSQLAPEARYNRALVLIKLERYEDAKQALAPFATAAAGSYRQVEAAKLLAALPAKP